MNQKDGSALDTLLQQLKSDDESIRKTLSSLYQQNTLPDDIYEKIAPFVKHPDIKIRNAVMLILQKNTPSPASISDFTKNAICHSINETQVQISVAQFMFQMVPSADIKIQKKTCEALLESKNEEFRLQVLDILVQWKSLIPETGERLSDLLFNGTAKEKLAAISTYEKLPTLASQNVINELFKLLKNDLSPTTRMLCASALKAIGPESKDILNYALNFLADPKNRKAYLKDLGLE